MIMLDESLMNLLEGFVGFVNNEVEYFCLMRIMEKGTIGSRTLPISYHTISRMSFKGSHLSVYLVHRPATWTVYASVASRTE